MTELKRKAPLARVGKRKQYTRKPSPVLRPIELPANVTRNDGASNQVSTQSKDRAVVSRALRASARGQDCMIEIFGVCNHDSSTTVLAHLPSEFKGSKATDLSSAFACSDCHDVIDGRVQHELAPGELDWYMRRAMVRTWTRWLCMGLIEVKGAA